MKISSTICVEHMRRSCILNCIFKRKENISNNRKLCELWIRSVWCDRYVLLKFFFEKWINDKNVKICGLKGEKDYFIIDSVACVNFTVERWTCNVQSLNPIWNFFFIPVSISFQHLRLREAMCEFGSHPIFSFNNQTIYSIFLE